MYIYMYINVRVFLFFIPTHDNSYSQKNTAVTKPILISISQNVSIISVTQKLPRWKILRGKFFYDVSINDEH